jgi:hypothetical protein|tara:strand:- start:5093 stop:5551 length:459 start_codon:yes stop_codon:yes gene_type:complete
MKFDIFKNFNDMISSLNNNKFFAGIIMLILNLGSKFITIEFSDSQQAYLRNTVGRQLLIFAIAWIGTKDIYTSLIITAVFVVLADYLFNENSKLCVLPKSFKDLKKSIDLNNDNIISDEELQKAIKILDEHRKASAKIAQKNAYLKFKQSSF